MKVRFDTSIVVVSYNSDILNELWLYLSFAICGHSTVIFNGHSFLL